MATFSAILVPSGNGVTATLAGPATTGGITLSTYAKFGINATVDVQIVFYSSKTLTPPVPSATVGFRIPAGATMTFDLGSSKDTFAIFSATAATYSYQVLSVTS
jgi:hypothetical protein